MIKIRDYISISIALLASAAFVVEHFDLTKQLADSQVYTKLTRAFTREVQVEVLVPAPIEPTDPQSEVVASYVRARNSRLPAELAQLIANEIVLASKTQGTALPLVVGMVEHESLFNPMATATIPADKKSAAKGLMQIYQGEGIEIDQAQAYDLKYNLETGCKILAGKLELNNGNLERALSNYSGNAEGYASSVLENVGRFALYQLR